MTRQPHEWNSTDIALYGMGKMDMTDAEQVAGMREANWTPAVQYWRERAEKFEAEMVIYKAAAKSFSDALVQERAHADRLFMALLIHEGANGWNDTERSAITTHKERRKAGSPPPDDLVPQPLVTRFEVIDDTGRAYTRHGVSVGLSRQDEGRTLKVFVKEASHE
jgi:hypothetical protein